MTIPVFFGILRSMKILRATLRHVPAVVRIIDACKDQLHSQGNITQWTEQYPSKDLLKEDIRRGELFAAFASPLEGTRAHLAGLIVIEPAEPDEAHRDTSWLQEGNPAVFLTRLAVDPPFQNQGIGTRLFDYAERYALAQGVSSIRIDADKNQLKLIQRYEQRGYRRVGTIWYDDPSRPFYAMEKLIPPMVIHWASEDELANIFSIRDAVFVEGQHVAKELERDGLDDQADHVILYEHGEPVGCARIRLVTYEMEGSETATHRYWKVERLAVLEHARRKGYGKLIMEWITREACTEALTGLTLHAQSYLEGFYQDLGFTPSGKHFIEAGISHVPMILELPQLKNRL